MQKHYTAKLYQILNTYAPAGQEATELIFEISNIETFRKDEVIFHQNRYNGFEYFQLEGISHRFNTDSDKHTLTTGIYQNETIITPHFTRAKNGQSIFSLQALTDCTYLSVPTDTFDELREQNEQIKTIGRVLIEKEFIRSLNFEVIFGPIQLRKGCYTSAPITRD